MITMITPYQKRPSSVYYANNVSQCHWLLSNKKDRCKREVLKGKDLCSIHERIREEEKRRHRNLIHSKRNPIKNPMKKEMSKKHGGTAHYDYDYYLDDNIEPFDSNASMVIPNVWIGSIDSAHDANFLKERGIKSVVNISGMEPTVSARELYKKLGIAYHTLSTIKPVANKPIYTVTEYLGDEKFNKKTLTPRQFFKYMLQGVQILNQPGFQFPVLIHCFAGMNRSAALIAAYLLTKPHPYTYEKTIELLKKANERRGLDVLTNSDFKRSLKYFPIYMGKIEANPVMLSRYNQYLKSYEI